MRRLWWMAAALALAACSGGGESASAPAMETAAVTAAPAAAPAQDGRAVTSPPGAPAPAVPGATPLLAYAYTATLETPPERVAPLMRAHERACSSAGPSVCQVLQADLAARPADEAVRATLRLQAQPAWLASFRAGLERDARTAGGRLVASGTATEDLTRAIVDSEATLRAQVALRDRLQQMLSTRSGTLAEVLEIERELARVQGEIDALQSNLAVMRARVSTSALTLTYQSEGVAVSEGAFAPLAEAGDDFLRNFVQALAVLITLVSVLLPFALVGLLVLWLVLFARRRGWLKRRAKAAVDPPQRTSPPT